MKINEVTTVITEKPKDKSKVPNRLAALDKDGDKVLWKDVIKDPSKAHAEIDVDGIDYKIYIDDKDNNMYVFDASRGSFVKADQNFVRRAMGKNLSSRLSPQRDPKFTDIVRSYIDKDDLRQPGAGQATKSSNIGGVIGSRIGGHIDNLIKRIRGKLMTTKYAGFIGLGNIGQPMAQHLNASNFPLMVFDHFPEAMASLVEAGAKAASNAAEIAQYCNYIGLCVRDDNDVNDLLYGDQGILEYSTAGTLIAIHSTVTQASLLRWASDAAAKDIHLIDAPMTGGANGAEAGTLCYMVGGESAQIEQCRPYLNTSAAKIIHAGNLGAGIALKLCNNLITYSQFTAMSEATRLAEACSRPCLTSA